MKIYLSFDTKPHPEDTDLRSNLRKHVNFVYADEPTTPPHEREMVVKSNTNNLMQLLSLEVKPQLELLEINGLLKVCDDQETKIQYIMVPWLGKLQLEFDETVEDFLVTKLNK